MVPWHVRFLRAVHRWIWILASLVVVVIAAAMIFGVSTDPTALPQTQSPGDTVRNFFPTLFGELRGLAGFSVYAVFILMGILQFVGIFWFMARGTTQTLKPGQYDVNLDHVRGQPEIVGQVRQIMHIFQGHREFKAQFGGQPPRGLLFEGPPGTGKTLLAKAIAGETHVPFIYASGAGFANMFLGIPQLKVRSMFKQARKLSDKWGGCVIFLDEFDAIGGARQGVSNARDAYAPVQSTYKMVVPGFGGGDSMLVNALLTEMDGIDRPKFLASRVRRLFRMTPAPVGMHNILVVGATNRAQTLDPALLRPGRFDRKIHVGNPSEEGRRDVIAFYLSKVAHVPIDIDRLAKATAGYSPARIKSLINEGLIFAHRAGRDAVSYDDIWQAKLHDEVGIAEPVTYSETELRITAIHEAGHAIAIQFLDPNRPVQIVTARKRGSTLGLVHSQEQEERFSRQRDEILTDIKVSLAGMVAEEIWLGQSSSGPSSDLRAATANALQMVTHFGMGSTLVSHSLIDGHSMTDDGVSAALKDPKIHAEVNAILQQCKAETRTFLEEHRQAMELTRDALIQHDELTGDQFRMLLFQHGLIPKPPAEQVPLPVLPPYDAYEPAAYYSDSN